MKGNEPIRTIMSMYTHIAIVDALWPTSGAYTALVSLKMHKRRIDARVGEIDHWTVP